MTNLFRVIIKVVGDSEGIS
ncbi:hypothetical protein [Plasmodium yoelii yoelii]|uniref:Uncharacterized protein n=1 Tax=Plasmodium yoelii yoelii TaxID=73239 RepID=Q7RLE4_PLAYO|nr:hypothetical protein [Plasmodium yoelii yoelii]